MENLLTQFDEFTLKNSKVSHWTLQGSFCSLNALNFKSHINNYQFDKTDFIIMDLTKVKEIDVVAINTLVKLKMHSFVNKIKFKVIVNLDENILSYFKKTKMLDILNVFIITEEIQFNNENLLAA